MSVQPDAANPREAYAKPPYPEQTQAYPGQESAMEPRPDYGRSSYAGKERLVGKKALMTGGDSGIGRAVALASAREGAAVLIAYLSKASDARKTADAVREAGRKCIT